MDQPLLQYPKTKRGIKENLLPPAIPCDMNNFSRTISKMSSDFAPGSSSPQENDMLEQECHPVDLASVCLHQGNHSQVSHCPLEEMSLMTLAKCCTEEINKYRRNEPSDERYGMEIVRRATVLRDDDAWATLQRQFTENAHSWFAHHTYREVALRHENEQDYIDHAFRRFWQATSDQALTFTSLAGALHYLRLCLHCAIMDTLRLYTHTRLEMLPEEGHPNEPRVEDRYNESELWEAISNLLANERDRRVAYLHFHCNLKPRDIMRHCPGEFSNEEEIYRIKRNILERIMRNIDKIRWRLS
jgi:hypothetical protein